LEDYRRKDKHDHEHVLRSCASERIFKDKKKNQLEITQSPRYDNLSRQEKESILKDMMNKLNNGSPNPISENKTDESHNPVSENKTEENIVNISYISENGELENSREGEPHESENNDHSSEIMSSLHENFVIGNSESMTNGKIFNKLQSLN